MSSIDFYSLNSHNQYYIDDVVLQDVTPIEVDPCPFPDALICDNIDDYTEGAIGPQSDMWTTWSGTEGGAEDGIVSGNFSASNHQSMFVDSTGTQDVVLLLGNEVSGSYVLNWNMYVPQGASAYFNLQGSETIGAVYVYEAVFNQTGDTPGEGAIGDNAFTFPQGEWFTVSQEIDLDNDEVVITIAGNMVATIANTDNMSSIDFYSFSGNNLYYIDDVVLEDVTIINPSVGELTFVEFAVYPTPNNGTFSLVNNSISGEYTIQLIDVLGKVVYSETMDIRSGAVANIDTRITSSGIYMVKMINNENSQSQSLQIVIE